MKPHDRLLTRLATLAVLALPTATVQAQPLPAERLQAELEAAVSSQATQFQAALLAVHRRGEPLWTGAAGTANLATGDQLTPDAHVRAGSIAKPFVATVTLQLVEEGAFGLDDPINALLPPEVTDRFPQANRITVRMLLQHTSGIPEWIDGHVIDQIAGEPGKLWNVTEYLDLAAAKPLPFEPGNGWAYSNTDYNVLGLIIEQATGTSWREQIRKRIIEPLDLASTSLPEPGTTTLTAMTTFLDARSDGGQTGYGLGLQRFTFPEGLQAIGHLGSTAGYFAFVGKLPGLHATLALAIDGQLDPTPVLVAAITALTSRDP